MQVKVLEQKAGVATSPGTKITSPGGSTPKAPPTPAQQARIAKQQRKTLRLYQAKNGLRVGAKVFGIARSGSRLAIEWRRYQETGKFDFPMVAEAIFSISELLHYTTKALFSILEAAKCKNYKDQYT